MVSVADTKKMSATDTMAPTLNSGANGMICGSANNPTSANPLKSTLPMNTAST